MRGNVKYLYEPDGSTMSQMLEYFELLHELEREDVPLWAKRIMVRVLGDLWPYLRDEERTKVEKARESIKQVLEGI